MIGEYKGYAYYVTVSGDQVCLLTHKQQKKQKGFESKRDYYKKSISLSDSDLNNVFEIHFWVKYQDDVEGKKLWCVDEGRAVGEKPDISSNKVVIDVDHDMKDSTWIQYDKGAASKTICLMDCEEYIVEKRYLKKSGIITNDVERTSVSFEVFKKTMIMTRRTEL